MRIFQRLKQWAVQLRQQVLTVYFAARDARAPRGLRMLALAVAAYAISPIDLIPDFIPIAGYLDDLILVPLGISAVMHWMPPQIIAAAQLSAQQFKGKVVSYIAAGVVIALWLIAAWLLFRTCLGK